MECSIHMYMNAIFVVDYPMIKILIPCAWWKKILEMVAVLVGVEA